MSVIVITCSEATVWMAEHLASLPSMHACSPLFRRHSAEIFSNHTGSWVCSRTSLKHALWLPYESRQRASQQRASQRTFSSSQNISPIYSDTPGHVVNLFNLSTDDFSYCCEMKTCYNAVRIHPGGQAFFPVGILVGSEYIYHC